MAQSPLHKLLIVEDDPLFARTLRLQLSHERFAITFCAHTAIALRHLARDRPDLILLDIHLGGHEEGLTALPKLIAAAPDVPIVVHSVLADHATVVRAMRQGAHDYIPKHVGIKTLGDQLAQAIAQRRAARPDTSAAPCRAETGGMWGQSAAMAALRRDIALAQRSQGSVIVNGEPGSGKELVARALARPQAPFVAVDASTLEGPLATSLLFGHERGAFTGADRDRVGLFEQAHGGVLYLDEVANMSLEVQAKLLRVLQEREVVRLGGHVGRPVSLRLVCATHSDLAAACRAGTFRFDLLTRLQVFTLTVPPLRERMDDLPLLFGRFVARYSSQDGRPEPSVAPATWAALSAYAWPGNVRELQHAAQVAVARCEGEVLTPSCLPAHVMAQEAADGALMAAPLGHDAPEPTAAQISAAATPFELGDAANSLTTVPALPIADDVAADGPTSFYGRVRAFERQALIAAYAQSAGNISAMARALQMDRSSLYAKLRLYAIHHPRPA